jgi:glycosyltransferase involved in cell wall biosynthesis
VTATEFSIVMPSFNQGHLIEASINSVLGQERVSFELIIVDGLSTDSTGEVLDRFLGHSNVKVIREKDSGQTEALTKGFSHATGKFWCWLNSDDLYSHPLVLYRISQLFSVIPDFGVIYADSAYLNEDGSTLVKPRLKFNKTLQRLAFNFITQPSSFVRSDDFKRVGGLDQSFNYAMDYDLYCRLAASGVKFFQVKEVLAFYRLHASSKTVAEEKRFIDEFWHVRKKNLTKTELHISARFAWVLRGLVFLKYIFERGVIKGLNG